MNEIIDINETSDRFTTQPSDISIITDDGKILYGDKARQYLQEKKNAMLKVKELIPVGTIVQLQSTGLVVKVISNDGEVFKYNGKNDDYPDRTFLFNQEDIDFIVEESIGSKTL